MHLLFVCTGNTCRSPMAAFLARAKMQERNLGWTAESAGLYAGPGMPMTNLAADALKRRNVAADGHASQPVNAELVEKSDLILTMTSSHARELQARFPNARHKIFELCRYVQGDAPEDVLQCDIVDPFGGTDEEYERCAERLEVLLAKLIDKLSSKQQSGSGEGD